MSLVKLDQIRKIIGVLKDRDNFLITSHVNPEGDSIGSQLAMYHILKKLGKKAVMVDQNETPDNLKFLPCADQITQRLAEGIRTDVVVVLDCPVLDRIGNVQEYVKEGHFVVNIDHHISNEFFGNITWVESEMSSVGEMLFYLAKEMDIEIDSDLARYVYSAIVTDTGKFNYDNTTPSTHRVAAQLLEGGVRPKKMYGELFEKKSLAEVRLLGKALSTLKVEGDGRLAYMSLTRKMYKEEGVEFISTDEFINFPRSIKGVEITVFFKEGNERDKKINVSFRSKGKINVNEVASCFGGGGHQQAAGCVLDLSLEEAERQVVEKVKEILKVSE